MKVEGHLGYRVGIAASGVYYFAFGALLFFSPYFFWKHIAPIGVFNEHYARDIGSIFLPLGIFLLMASYQPTFHRDLLALAAAASALHAISHLADGINNLAELVSGVALCAIALVLVSATLRVRKEAAR